MKFSDKVDPRTGVFTRTHRSGEVEDTLLECGPNHFAIARLKSGDTVETEMPNLTLQLLQGVLRKVKPAEKAKAEPKKNTKMRIPSKRPAAQEAEPGAVVFEGPAAQEAEPGAVAVEGSDDSSEVEAVEPEEPAVAEARMEWYKKGLGYGIKLKNDEGKWPQVMTIGKKTDQISQEKKKEVAARIVGELEKGMSVADAKHLAAAELSK